jgi:hypothetical protein
MGRDAWAEKLSKAAQKAAARRGALEESSSLRFATGTGTPLIESSSFRFARAPTATGPLPVSGKDGDSFQHRISISQASRQEEEEGREEGEEHADSPKYGNPQRNIFAKMPPCAGLTTACSDTGSPALAAEIHMLREEVKEMRRVIEFCWCRMMCRRGMCAKNLTKGVLRRRCAVWRWHRLDMDRRFDKLVTELLRRMPFAVSGGVHWL